MGLFPRRGPGNHWTRLGRAGSLIAELRHLGGWTMNWTLAVGLIGALSLVSVTAWSNQDHHG
ncbi:MAG: hypothetical protein ACPGYL_10845, partial [Rhodospirillaceae bacterium]